MTGPKRLIEVDEQTAIALEAKAAERGLSVPDLVAEMASIATSHEVLSTDDIVELDRRWPRSKRSRPFARQCSCGGFAPGDRQRSNRGMTVKLEWPGTRKRTALLAAAKQRSSIGRPDKRRPCLTASRDLLPYAMFGPAGVTAMAPVTTFWMITASCTPRCLMTSGAGGRTDGVFEKMTRHHRAVARLPAAPRRRSCQDHLAHEKRDVCMPNGVERPATGAKARGFGGGLMVGSWTGRS